jgi:hypothetical protein
LIAKVKEKTMANKKFCLGILVLVMVLVFGMVTVSCIKDPEYTWEFINSSNQTVSITNTNFDPSSFTLAPAETKKFTIPNSSVTMQYSPADKVEASRSSTSEGGIFIFTNK